MDDIELDNERHRREEQERRVKRQKNRDIKSKVGPKSEKERKRREHAQRILGAQKRKTSPAQSSSSVPSQTDAIGGGGSSVFQSLFHERAEGFFIDLRFRNAPPRPPVGPAFVGLGLDGELTNKWTKYKARNDVENQYSWKIHPEHDLGVPLAVSAMDFEECYSDPAKNDDIEGEKDREGKEITEESNAPQQRVIVALHPDDEALINWKGSTGDMAAEQLQQKQDRVRAAARVAITQGYGAMPQKTLFNAHSFKSNSGANNNVGNVVRLKKHHLLSRILDEKTPNFMKKTTYLTNNATSVHRFTSLALKQVQRANDDERALAETKTKYSEMDVIEMGFSAANALDIGSDATGKERRIHSSKKDIFPLWDLPLLPDLPTWGHTFTHVVLDNPPKNISSRVTPSKTSAGKKRRSDCLHECKQLQKVIVADVMKHTQNAWMSCTMWVPEPEVSIKSGSESVISKSPRKKLKHGQVYKALQQYDLDVVPLHDSSGPPVHYVWKIHPSKAHVGYHCVGSRVQLSTGRPVSVVSVPPHGAKTAELVTDKSYISHVSMKEEDKKAMGMRVAEVDLDLAEKYGLEVDGLDEEGNHESGKWERKTHSVESESRSESDDMEADAF